MFALSVVVAVISCDLERTCTCAYRVGKLVVWIAPGVPDAFTLTAKVSGEDDRVVECSANSCFRNHDGWTKVELIGLVAPEVTIQMEFGDVIVHGTYYPEYVANTDDPDCIPQCSIGGILVDLSKMRRSFIAH